ncbi:hypothetical protein BC567DRAFT_33890 [Phyllosticta citribraziliensis]
MAEHACSAAQRPSARLWCTESRYSKYMYVEWVLVVHCGPPIRPDSGSDSISFRPVRLAHWAGRCQRQTSSPSDSEPAPSRCRGKAVRPIRETPVGRGSDHRRRTTFPTSWLRRGGRIEQIVVLRVEGSGDGRDSRSCSQRKNRSQSPTSTVGYGSGPPTIRGGEQHDPFSTSFGLRLEPYSWLALSACHLLTIDSAQFQQQPRVPSVVAHPVCARRHVTSALNHGKTCHSTFKYISICWNRPSNPRASALEFRWAEPSSTAATRQFDCPHQSATCQPGTLHAVVHQSQPSIDLLGPRIQAVHMPSSHHPAFSQLLVHESSPQRFRDCPFRLSFVTLRCRLSSYPERKWS